ncbi:MAG: type II secretion system protein GspD [Hyphomonas sp.]|uniref:type II secretion system secretin GspD n=1 Tax=Hyphomonas sp. TaxID=87 RepID=UPI00185CA8B0|nr:type II secretion system secretin GspD [Hyphomonas sp.]MBA3070131.1 type II secretion system protein GspD [Hyphomonas sp.]MBU4060293.1 type II secretion system secretin GspD [Alphaproteobacteria bacterium]MBU4162961.1 type II secretion system secretin GspD [Alphaproteobacteria bacterium]
MTHRILLAAAAALTVSQVAAAQAPAPVEEKHVLKLEDVELNTLIADVSMLTGYTFITHPDVRKARVSVVSQTPMSKAEVFQVFLTTLRVQGFAAIPAGKDTYRIVPEAIAATEAPTSGQGANAFVTEIIKLDNANAMDVAQQIKPVLDSQGQVAANANTNTLVIVDYASNLQRVRRMIETIDRDQSVTETVALRNVPALEMEAVLNRLQGDAASAAAGQSQGSKRFVAVASQTSNAILLRGDSVSVERARRVALQLDDTEPQRDNIRIIPLNYTDAGEIVPILERLGQGIAAQRSPSDTAPPSQSISHHPATNSLIISGNAETLVAMEKVIAALDVRRPQVMVEAIIVEMSDDTAKELGLQFLLSGTGGSDVPFASTNFSRSAPSLLALTGALITDGFEDLSKANPFRDAAISSLTGSSGLTLGFGGQSGDSLFGVILNAVENDTNSRILSTPFGMTLNNATSSLIVGQEIPVTTGQVLGDANSNPFRTVEREDVGIKLEVTPRIGENDTVRLDIRQEVSSVFGSVGTLTPDLILDKREINASVLADDGEIIVLGGLVEQTDTVRQSKVPVLGDLPFAGRLFRSDGKATTRTNLMVFIRPTIVRNKEDARDLTEQKYLYVRGQELMRGVAPENSIDSYVAEVLGGAGPMGSAIVPAR